MDVNALLKKLSQTTGLSGYETKIRAEVLAEWGRFVDETRTDKVGNAVAVKRGYARQAHRKIMLASHMDEIGFMVAGFSHGFLRVSPIGGIDARVLPGQEVIVHSRQRDLPGIISSTPPHLLKPDDRSKVISLDQLWIDVGLAPAQVNRLVSIGDLVSIRRDVTELKNGLLAGKAFDNRASVAAVAVCLELLATIQHQWDVIAVATVQEETSALGAATSAFGIAPDAAIAIDVTYGVQYGSAGNEVFPLDKGPTIGIGPNMQPKMTQGLIEAAQRIKLDHQIEPMAGSSGTDGWLIQVVREGIPTGVVGIPLRSMHTPVEVVSPRDVEQTGRLLAEFIGGLDEKFYKSLME